MAEKYINNENRNLPFSKNDYFYLVFLIALGGIVRLYYHHNRPFVGDEVGTLIYMKESASFILSHFSTWLSMNYFILLEKALLWMAEDNRQILVLVPELAGITTIPLTAILAKMLASKKVALISATLVTFNPYLISFSGIIRSYSLLTALSLLAIILFFKWYKNRTSQNGIYASLVCYLLMLSHLNGAYTLAYIGFLFGLELLYTLVNKSRANLSTMLIPLSVSLILTIISYMKIVADVLAVGVQWQDQPPTSIAYIPYVFSSYFGSGFYGWLSIILMTSAILLTFRTQKPLLILMPYIVLPIILISIQGISHFPWAYARFLILIVPICIIFIAEGIEYFSLYLPINKNTIMTGITVMLIASWLPGLEQGYRIKISEPWNQIAAFIEGTPKGRTILSNSWVEELYLRPYFDDTSFIQSELSSYSEEQHKNAAGKNVYFVVTRANISSNYPVSTFGDIQVIIYPKTTYADQLALIRTDLQNRVATREVSPDLTDVYRNLWVLNTKLNSDPWQSFSYYDLYVQCFQLTERQRYKPLSVQYWELESFGYNVKR